MRRYRDAIDAGLLKIMSKMGISVVSSYRGGLNFEAVGLSRAMVAEYFPGMQSRISGIGLNGIVANAAARKIVTLEVPSRFGETQVVQLVMHPVVQIE